VSRPVLAAEIKELIGSGIKMGFSNPSEPLLARADGVPIKIVASVTGYGPAKVYVRSDSPIISVKDLEGKKVGNTDLANLQYRQLLYLSSKFGIKLEPVPLGNLTNQVVALKLGKIDAFITASVAALGLVETGELRILLHIRDILPNPQVAVIIWATDDLITQDPDLVRRFVKATLEVAKYLKENPGYTADLYRRRTDAPKDLADKTISDLDWTPSGRGTGSDLTAAVVNHWQFNKDSGAVPASTWEKVKIEDAVDVRFLP
jgi:NitT/TauT family transport system substrate-binding protein